MTAELRRRFFLAFAGLLAGFALVVTLFGTGELLKRGFVPSATKETPPTVAALPPAAETPSDPGATAGPGKSQSAGERAALPPSPDASPIAPESGGRAQDATAEPPPSFDIIRVEPNGDAVIAGRGAPNTTVELLRDNQPIARALIDPSGQFAIVPPALPTGNSEITLRTTGADGQVRVAKESVVVVVAQRRDAKPLIALTSPDKPTVVISQPEPVASPTAAEAKTAKVRPGKADGGTSGPQAALAPGADRNPKATAPAPVKIVSVDAEEGGRLYVTSQASPGATVRLYLNDTLVAPGSAGPDGRVAFTIGRGVKPGDYRIRVDQVDPVSGKVKTRSEVAFAVPAAPAKTPAREKPVETARTDTLTAPLAALAQSTPPQAPSSPAERQASTAPMAPAATQDRPVAAAKPVPPAIGMQPDTATPMIATAPQPGSVQIARPDLPAVDEPRTVFVPEIGTAKIIRGDNLWQISRRIYGKGTRYTVIFDANQPQIRDPHRIFPGQIFVVPPEATEAARADGKRG